MSASAADRHNQILLAAQPLYALLDAAQEEITPEPIALNPELPADHPILQLCNHFQLTESERDILLLCLLFELKPQLKFASGRLQKDEDLNYPTFALARMLLKSYTSRVLTAQSPLNYWRLITTENTLILSESSLTIDPYIFCYLLGETDLDSTLINIVQPVASTSALPLTSSHQQLVEQLAQSPFSTTLMTDAPYVELSGSDAKLRCQIAAQICKTHQRLLYKTTVLSLPTTSDKLNPWRRKWERHALLTGSILLLEISDEALTENLPRLIATRLLTDCRTPIITSVSESVMLGERTKNIFELPPHTAAAREALWSHCLGEQAQSLNNTIPQIAQQFALQPQQIAHLAAQLPPTDNPQALSTQLWKTCRQAARPQLQDLAQRVTTRLTWDDLIFPEETTQELKSIIAAVRQRTQVYQDWGFAKPEDRGLGIIALFVGLNGTGKTTAAEMIARELELDCYRIDLSNIVNKYIGETEKNLKRVFDAAEGSGAMLLFDEADAVFGMRGEVKEARDRYANQEVSYLLQRLETYPGLVILTTNLKDSIDRAFIRRLRYLIEFPKPTVKERQEIWERVFPLKVPTEGLHYRRLAELNVTGANIRNIALTAAFLAADAEEPITMGVLEQAARVEYRKLGRSLSSTEAAAIRMKQVA